ncbi:MAG: helix-turn-helix domain-containing protein [Myxococcota bacterium]
MARDVWTMITINDIAARVSAVLKIPIVEMRGKKRTAAINTARKVAMALAYEFTKLSYQTVGDWFGCRDHATVLHSHRTAERHVKSHGMLAAWRGLRDYLVDKVKETKDMIDDYNLQQHAGSFRDGMTVCSMAVLDALVHYVEHRAEPGHFLMAVLCNDLFEAFGRADDQNTRGMAWLVGIIYNNVPSPLWGSKSQVKAHLSGETPDRCCAMDWSPAATALRDHYEAIEEDL